MSQFFRMPNQWHNELDASLRPIYPIEYMTGSLNKRIGKRLVHVLEKSGPVNKDQFCANEGIKMESLNSALTACLTLLWEDDGMVGLLE